MIDNVKIYITDQELINTIWDNPRLCYSNKSEPLNKRTAEIKTNLTREYKHLKFIKYSDCLIIVGSLHYYYNNGLHNANDFSIVDCIKTVENLISDFGLIPDKCVIQNIEFGLNLPLRIPVDEVIKSLKYHAKNEFRNSPELEFSKFSASYNSDHKVNNYKIIKAYAKGYQTFADGRRHAPENTLRFEVKSKQSKYFNTLEIYTLENLTKLNIYKRVTNEILNEYDKVLLIDRRLRSQNNKRLNKYLYSEFWDDCITSSDRNKFTKQKKEYLKILNRYPENMFHLIRTEIVSKIGAFSTGLENYQKSKNGAYSTISIIGNCTTLNKYCQDKGVTLSKDYIQEYTSKYCQVTGLNISMQRDNSFLLSHTGLKYYLKHEPETFATIKQLFLTDFWNGAKTNIQIKEIAHQIRNTFNRRSIKQEKLYPKNSNLLFDLNSLSVKENKFCM
ncbi:MAG TPA: hypothetical protein PLL66_01610 [Bacteroidales bacterium]|nr:hypothetical protein [Bacteroidales bacterium]